ncbi:MAG: amino acid permease [Alphaproteobacteria bacterium]|nr:MAG: amino acid permease [Alphaproteobacteria bacterium]
MSQKKLGFLSIFSLVVGSQIGSGIFATPFVLAPYGLWGALGWAISGSIAVVLAIIFAKLCMQFPKTGGPHVYALEGFGETAGFFVGWAYWIASWASTPIVTITAIAYLSSVLPIQNPLIWQISLLAFITLLNMKSVAAAGKAEFILTLFKIIPLVAIPLIALYHFDVKNIKTLEVIDMPSIQNIIMTTLFCFLGLESATAPAEFVDQPQKTIPKAIIAGTTFVALVYLLNSLGLLGLVDTTALMHSKAPYADATSVLFGNFSFVMAIIGAFVCISTLNAWVLTSGQIAYGLAKDGLFPSIFKKQNRNGSPYVSVIVSSLLIVPLLILIDDKNVSEQISLVLDYSMILVLFVYGVSSLALIKLLKHRVLGGLGFVICFLIAVLTPFAQTLVSCTLILLGIPMFIYIKRKK